MTYFLWLCAPCALLSIGYIQIILKLGFAGSNDVLTYALAPSVNPWSSFKKYLPAYNWLDPPVISNSILLKTQFWTLKYCSVGIVAVQNIQVAQDCIIQNMLTEQMVKWRHPMFCLLSLHSPSLFFKIVWGGLFPFSSPC